MSADAEVIVCQPRHTVPLDGTPVTLVLENANQRWRTSAAFAWNGKRWISQSSGLPLPGVLDVVGWERVSDD